MIFTAYTSAHPHTAPIIDTSGKPASKEGSATCSNVLGLFAFGDCSIEAAASDGKITKIKSVNYEHFTVLGLYSSYTTVVKGD